MAKKKEPQPIKNRSAKEVSEKDWQEMEARYMRGESARKLGQEFRVLESTIRYRFAQTAHIKAVAQQVVAADEAFKSLPVPAQVTAQHLIDELKAVSMHLAGAAKYGASTAHRLSGIANRQIDKISDIDPIGDEDSARAIKSISILTNTANASASLGMDLLKANAERMAEIAKKDEAKVLAKQARAESNPDDAYKRMLNANA